MGMTQTVSTPFDRSTTAAEVVAGLDLSGRRIIVTGGASGIGVETARALASAGAELTLAVRNPEAGERTAADIRATTGNELVSVAPLDLADRASVRAFVAGWDGPLHVLVNNAGMMASPLMRTPEGWEMQFATNHLGHFALATGLLSSLRAADGARIVSVRPAAGGLARGTRPPPLRPPVVFEDVHFQRREYEPWSAYGQSKTANVLFAVAATDRWGDDGITANALMPGAIRTNLQRYISEEEMDRMRAASGGGAAYWK